MWAIDMDYDPDCHIAVLHFRLGGVHSAVCPSVLAAGLANKLCCSDVVVFQVVIGNLLETRKTQVLLVMDCEEKWIRVENPKTEEIEKFIVAELIARHTKHISSSSSSSTSSS